MKWAAKRIYASVGVRSADGGFAVTLDDRPVTTPAGTPMPVPSAALARAIADEWAAQGETVRPDSMPLAQLAMSCADRVRPGRAAVIDDVARYAETDLLCYRAAGPDELVKEQEAAWRPLLDWADEAFGARLTVTAGVMPVAQPPVAVAALRAAVGKHDDIALTTLSCATAVTGSVVVALALVAGRLDAGEAFDVSQVDEAYQTRTWGDDAEARARRERLRRDLAAAARFLALGSADQGGMRDARRVHDPADGV